MSNDIIICILVGIACAIIIPHQPQSVLLTVVLLVIYFITK